MRLTLILLIISFNSHSSDRVMRLREVIPGFIISKQNPKVQITLNTCRTSVDKAFEFSEKFGDEKKVISEKDLKFCK